MTGCAKEILKTVFGYDQFRGQQQEIIEEVINGHDVLVLMPTGGGKSLCFQIPALLRRGVGIVISPLIALMQDQVSALQLLGVKAAYLNSTLTLDEIRAVEQQLLNGDLDLLYVAPERVTSERTLALFSRLQIALFAIDEAHCVSQWGHDFRADYLQLSLLHQRFPDVPRIALTATADERTREEISERLSLEQARLFIGGFDRPNIRYRIVQKDNARHQLMNFIQSEHAGDAGIVYCMSRKKVDALAEWLNEKGVRALPYHAGMDSELRKHNQDRFLMEEGLIIVATIAFGMGIDKSNVRFVAHMDLPKSIEAYYQETGRAGRDGLPADAWMVYGLQDVILLQQMLAMSTANESRKRLDRFKLDAMLALCEEVSCRRRNLLTYFGDDLEQDCGNCDTCLEPVATWDGTIAAQQAFSCIYRTGQRFGVTYLIEVLRGKNSERIKSFGHDQISTFGIGQNLDDKQWQSVFRQLAAKGLVQIDFEGFGSLKLDETCRPILKGEQRLMLRKDLLRKAEKFSVNSAKSTAGKPSSSSLWEALRQLRRQLADEQKVPPYLIFHDATLMEMVELRPASLEQLSKISGVGTRKLELYGQDFLDQIKRFNTEPKTDTVSQSLELFKLGFAAEQIASQRGLTIDTVYSHLARAIEVGDIPLEEVVGLSVRDIKQIQDVILNQDEAMKNALKPVFENFAGQYSYGVLRCVRAALQKAEI